MQTLRRRIGAMQSYLQQRESLLRFDAVSDPRGARGQRWPLRGLLATAVTSLALLARSLRRAEQLSEELCESRRLRRLGVRRRVPDSTLGDALSQVAPAELLAELHRQVRAEHRRKALKPVRLPVGVVAIDGKTQAVLAEPANPFTCQRQSGEHGPERFLHRALNATLVSSAACVCIHQQPIGAHTNEMGAFREFFASLDAAYRRTDLFEVVTTDAGVLCEAACRWLDAQGYGYVLALKDNNPLLELEARGLLQSLAEHESPVARDDGWQLDSSRGWVRRDLHVSSELAGWPGWEHLRQVWLVRVWAKSNRKARAEHLEDRVYVTNLPVAHRIRGRAILRLIRAHWRIENELHGTLDIHLREDDPWWVRRGYGLLVMGLLRAMAYNLLAIARAVHLRASSLPGWQQLRDWLRDALIWPELAEHRAQPDPAPE
jgi:hypothetical protein